MPEQMTVVGQVLPSRLHDITTGLPQIAADFLHRPSRQSRAMSGRPQHGLKRCTAVIGVTRPSVRVVDGWLDRPAAREDFDDHGAIGGPVHHGHVVFQILVV
jgi:hypothetical protein